MAWSLNQEIVKALALHDVRKQFANFDVEPVGNLPEQMAEHIKIELVKWSNVAREAKITPGALH